jgi:hypothetical protein
MTTTEALAELKTVLRETTYDAAWGDTLLTSYLAEGQDKFCEKTGFFQDFTTDSLTLVEDQLLYAIPARTIQIIDIWDGNTMLGKFMEQDRSSIRRTWNPSESIQRTGSPRAWQTDRTTGFINFDAAPTADQAGNKLDVFVWRYSSTDLTATDTIEIPDQFHRALIEYAAFKALSHHDMEQQDKIKARDHLAEFNAYIHGGKRAMQRLHGIETRVGTDQSYVY